MVSDQAVGRAGRIRHPPRDSLHLIDLIYSQEGGSRPEVIVTDTGSYSDIAFGLVTLLDFDYRPQLADLPDAKLWRIDKAASYGALNDAARGRIDLARIRRHWPDILRVVASIHTGAVSAHDVLRVVQPGERRPSSARPWPTLGGSSRAPCAVLRRQRALSAPDQGHTQPPGGPPHLARHLHGNKGELRHGYREGMEDQRGALGLILNCVTLWNTVSLDTALEQLRALGHQVLESDVARLSPHAPPHQRPRPLLVSATRAVRHPSRPSRPPRRRRRGSRLTRPGYCRGRRTRTVSLRTMTMQPAMDSRSS